MLLANKFEDLICSIAEHAVAMNLPAEDVLDLLRKRIVEEILSMEGGNQCRTAKRLGIHRNSVSRWLKELGIKP